jgi:hypothetical protein
MRKAAVIKAWSQYFIGNIRFQQDVYVFSQPIDFGGEYGDRSVHGSEINSSLLVDV